MIDSFCVQNCIVDCLNIHLQKSSCILFCVLYFLGTSLDLIFNHKCSRFILNQLYFEIVDILI